jgi:hypothetical protein
VSRPPKYNEQRAERVLEAIRAGATRRAAAGHAGVSPDTLERWQRRYAGFADSLTRAEDDIEVRTVALIQQAAQTDWKASAWWLERRRPRDYGRTWLTAGDDAVEAPMVHVTVSFDHPDQDTLELPASSYSVRDS